MHLIVGLGNPGAEYAGTRHNAGFMVVDRLAERHAFDPPRGNFHADAFEGAIADHKVLMLKPKTFMNRSGLSVGEAARFYKLQPETIMVIVDDTALPVGLIRLRGGGSDGGHNGLADTTRALGTDRYPRRRVGVGAPRIGEHKIPQADYVLSRFTDDQLDDLAPALRDACEAIELWITDDLNAAMNRFNRKADDDDTDEPARPQPETDRCRP